jgi:deazaflavin-dependent oxidoreductase (nitroreductase family)
MPEPLVYSKPPSGALRLAFRLPILLYRLHLGWLLGDRFLMMTHKGRKSGIWRKVVVEVVRHDKAGQTYYIASGWGKKSDWYKNILKNPKVIVNSGGKKMEAVAETLTEDQAIPVFRDYATRHPVAFRGLSKFMIGESLDASNDSLQRAAQILPLVALKPLDGNQ